MPLKYKVNVLSELKKIGYSSDRMRKEKLLSEAVMQNLRQEKGISWNTLEKLCKYLNCQPSDLLEYIPDDN